MPQNQATNFQNVITGKFGYPATDGAGSQLEAFGAKTALNQTVAGVVKVGAGRLVKIIVIAGGTTSGAFTLNDAATTGAAATSNVLFSVAFGATVGTMYPVDIPFTNGLVLSAVPGAGTPQLTLVYT